MRAKTERDALVEAITYYQRRLTKIDGEFKTLNDSVQNFIASVSNDNDDWNF